MLQFENFLIVMTNLVLGVSAGRILLLIMSFGSSMSFILPSVFLVDRYSYHFNLPPELLTYSLVKRCM
jgi:hypothetical protein